METLGSKLTSSEALESITAANNKQIGPCSNLRHATCAMQHAAGSMRFCIGCVVVVMLHIGCSADERAECGVQQRAVGCESRGRPPQVGRASQAGVSVRCTLSAARCIVRARCMLSVARCTVGRCSVRSRRRRRGRKSCWQRTPACVRSWATCLRRCIPCHARISRGREAGRCD